MPFIPEGYGEVVFRYRFPSVDDDQMVCTLGVALSDTMEGVAQADLVDLCDAWHDTCGNNLTNDLRWDTCSLYYTAFTGGSFVIDAVPSDAGPGASGTTGAGTKTAVVVRKHSILGGRQGRGRMFWAGPITTHLDDNENMNGTGLLAWQVQGIAFMEAFPFGGIQNPVVLHSVEREDQLPSTIVSLDAAQLTGTMRRRYRN